MWPGQVPMGEAGDARRGACILAPFASLLSWGGCVLSAGWPGWEAHSDPGVPRSVSRCGSGRSR